MPADKTGRNRGARAPTATPRPRKPPARKAGAPGLETNRIAVGDCLKHMAAWPEGSVDLVFADPPYNIGWQYDHYQDRRPGDEYVQWTEDWITAAVRLLKPTGSFYLLIGDEYAAEARLHLKKLEKEKKLQFRNWMIWHYTFGQNCKTKFNRSHAHLFYCVGSAACAHKGKADTAPYTFNRQAIAVPSARQTTYADARANPSGKMPDDVWVLRPQLALAAQPEGPPETPETQRRGKRSETYKNGKASLDDQAELGAFRGYFSADEDVWYLPRLCGTFKERL
ncbi:MAG: DNA methyltransferase, partial [Planctomycetota bacterium]